MSKNNQNNKIIKTIEPAEERDWVFLLEVNIFFFWLALHIMQNFIEENKIGKFSSTETILDIFSSGNLYYKTEYDTAGMCGFTYFSALTEPIDQSQTDIQNTELRKHCSFPILMCKVSAEEQYPAGKTCVSKPYWVAMINQLQSNREL